MELSEDKLAFAKVHEEYLKFAKLIVGMTDLDVLHIPHSDNMVLRKVDGIYEIAETRSIRHFVDDTEPFEMAETCICFAIDGHEGTGVHENTYMKASDELDATEYYETVLAISRLRPSHGEVYVAIQQPNSPIAFALWIVGDKYALSECESEIISEPKTRLLSDVSITDSPDLVLELVWDTAFG